VLVVRWWLVVVLGGAEALEQTLATALAC